MGSVEPSSFHGGLVGGGGGGMEDGGGAGLHRRSNSAVNVDTLDRQSVERQMSAWVLFVI